MSNVEKFSRYELQNGRESIFTIKSISYNITRSDLV